MRIIAGKYRSRRIFSAHSQNARKRLNEAVAYRPTTDRAKETLFNMLNNMIDFDGIKCLDLFAGSGALGFEALSRGASSCDFVDFSSIQTTQINRTAVELNIAELINVFNSEVFDFIDENQEAGYDLIFADPPYNFDSYEKLKDKIFTLGFGIFVLEHSSELNMLYDSNKYEVVNRNIGTTNFKIFSTREQ